MKSRPQHYIQVTEKMVQRGAANSEAPGPCGNVTFLLPNGAPGQLLTGRVKVESTEGPIIALHYDVQWTDVTPDSTGTLVDLNLGTVTFSVSHTFAKPGLYMPQITGGATLLLTDCTFIPQSVIVNIV